MSSGKGRPFCLGLHVFKDITGVWVHYECNEDASLSIADSVQVNTPSAPRFLEISLIILNDVI